MLANGDTAGDDMSDHDLPDLIQRYLEEEDQRLAAQTKRAYTSDLRTYASWLESQQLQETPPHLVEYVVESHTWSDATRARKRHVLVKFYDWAAWRELRPHEFQVMLRRTRLREPQSPALPLDLLTFQKVIASIPAKRYRDIVLFRLMGECGLRLSDVQTLAVEHLKSLPAGNLELTVGPPKRQRTIEVPQDLAELLYRYLSQREITEGPIFTALFNGHDGALRQPRLHTIWRRYAEPFGVRVSIGQLYQLVAQRGAGETLRTSPPN